MKELIYEGRLYKDVPDYVNFVETDYDRSVWGYEIKPFFMIEEGMWYEGCGQSTELEPYSDIVLAEDSLREV